DRNCAAAELGDLGRVVVDTGDLVSEVGKAGAGDEPDIACADHGNTHKTSPPVLTVRCDRGRSVLSCPYHTLIVVMAPGKCSVRELKKGHSLKASSRFRRIEGRAIPSSSPA